MPSTRPREESQTGTIYLEEEEEAGCGEKNRVRWEDSDKDRGTMTLSSSEGSQEEPHRKCSIRELVQTLSGDAVSTRELHPELERRVLDFRLAQQKRRQKHGEQQPMGVFGMYAHLSNVRIDLEWAEDAAWRRHHSHPYLTWSDFDDARRKSGLERPWFTYGLIFVCTIMLIVEIGLNGWKFEPLDVNPLIGPSAEALIRAGARDTAKIVEDGQWFRIFTPLLLHAGLVHYAINMAAVWFIGAAIEKSHGILNTVLIFLIPGVGGNILSAIFLPQYISVGASGGIFGLIGGCVADITLNWPILFIRTSEGDVNSTRRNLHAIFWIALEIFVNTILGFTPFVDNFSHLGGFFYGICCGWSIIEPLSVGFFGVGSTSWEKAKQLFVRFFGLILSVVAIMITTGWLASSEVGDSPCKNCRYISCVPFPLFQENKWWHCDDCDRVTAELYKVDEYYTSIDLTCPNQVIESIDISDGFFSDRDSLRHKLPSLCREHCDDRFN